MNKYYILLILVFFSIASCKISKENTKITTYKDSTKINSGNEIEIFLINGKSFNHPTYVVWRENMNEEYEETIFITKSYATGIFGFEMTNDSVWENQRGSSYQPAALPYWTYRKGLIDGECLVPEPEHPFVDAYTGATSQNNFKLKTTTKKQPEKYRIYLEVNQAWDWNEYWTNNKFPNNNAYKHSCQPSIIYAATINSKDSVFFMNPVGHGCPKGESGKLYTDISTLTTAKNIFKTIKITIKR